MKRRNGKYSVWENSKYVIDGVKMWQPLVLPLTIIHGLMYGLSAYVWLYAVKWIIEIHGSPMGTTDKVKQIFILIGVLSTMELVMLVISNLSDKGSEGRMHDVEYRFAQFWVTKVWTMPFSMHEDPEVQKNIFKARRAINNNGNGLAGLQYWTNQMLPHVVKVVIAFILLTMMNPFIVILIIILSYIRFDLINRASIYEKEQCENIVAKEQLASRKYQEEVADFTHGKDIRLFKMQIPLYRLLRKQSDILNKQSILAQNRYARNYVIGDILEFIQEGIAYSLLFYKVLFNDLSVADFTLYLGSIHNAVNALNEIFSKIIRINSESRHITDFREFIESSLKQEDMYAKSTFKEDYLTCIKAYEERKDEFKWDQKAEYEFIFEHVSFRYPGAKTYALQDVSLCLKAGEKLAIVGINGAGKSTFVKLLCRLYEPTEGHIYLNGKDIREYDLNVYRSLIAPVFQEDESLAFSIAQNVSMKKKDEQDRDKILDVLDKADLKKKIQELPEKMDTFLYKNLSDAGVDLSGGQKQKLMFARALYKESPVIILDEPTSALDAIAESKSYEDFNLICEGRTTVYISHRLSSTKFCDQIAMFESGQLIEYGTHNELMQKKAKYAGLFEVQAQYYTKEGKTLYA
ncbi:ABC transporter ATP-binding protein [Anaerocolumna xylanovorans]|uniref:ABC-type multidrug transport system, ATPase and permease component n=1 Tax=Anaerocolumna xylanovorans DSM 12503 TaxID=1121345 RepID=A0A1M7XWH0_9FIRM|nr:ABC transporter ATP-binding protein [Anaerocolumna xylanovorans]SHO43105.1 ABC-type multidrug transport system, ATPase and permease component [Anaerocolumna xylanovorans DSM 12503]